MNDTGSRPLRETPGRPMALAEWLDQGIAITRALGERHRHHGVHRDIRPSNILVDPRGRIHLAGAVAAGAQPRGALPYQSPEQAGRMNRPVDERSDLYSLGVTLYEMGAGTLPFQARNALEWTHCHLARQPPALADQAPGLPPAVCSIVHKLLQKSAEDRYQTAAGVEADLRHFAVEQLRSAAIDDFVPGTRDVPERLRLADQLYGREAETARLTQAYSRVAESGRSELALVSGYSGVGKSAVVDGLSRAVLARHGRFASGKFEQHKSDIPYSTIAQALRVLVDGVLSQPPERLAEWRMRLQQALGEHGRVVVQLVPQLEHVIGPQPALREVAPAEGSRRFQKAVQAFLAVFASEQTPLVLFIDDLQWLDAATLELLLALVGNPDFRHVLVVGAYRSNEVDPQHPMADMLERLRVGGTPLTELELAPLAVPHIEALVAFCLRDEQGRSAALAGLIWQKTQGNPFFARQFLAALADENLLRFDRESLGWQWDMARIRQRNYSDNVADLMSEKLSRLPAGSRRLLTLLASLGASAGISSLQRVAQQEPDELEILFRPAELAGLVTRSAGGYRFMHDRIQEAAYAGLPVLQRAAMHLDIARRLQLGASPSERNGMVFELVNQYARIGGLPLPDAEQRAVAALHLQAGRRAVAETAYAAALSYLAQGERLLPPDAWTTDHRLAFDLSRDLAECEFLAGSPERADARLASLAAHARSLVDQAGVASLQITVCLGLDQSARAIDTCLAFLKAVDTPWPLHPGRDEVNREYALLMRQMGDRSIESLLELPPMVDPLRRAMLDVLAAVLPPAFFSDENLVCLVLCRMARLSIEYGNTDSSPLAYAYLGMMVGPFFQDYPSAFRFGKLGYDLVEQGVHTRYRSRVYMCFSYHVLPWNRPLREGQPLLRRAFDVSRETGDVTYAGFSSCCLVSSLLASGEPLQRIWPESQERLDFVSAARFGLIVAIITSQQRFMATLMGRTERFGCFDDEGFDEASFEAQLDANRSLDIAACWYWIRKAQALFMSGEAGPALRALQKAEPLLWTTKGHLEFAAYHFYAGLVHASCCHGASAEEGLEHRARLEAHRQWLDGWARHCPENFRSRSALLAAEAARLRGADMDAMGFYEQAIAAARDGGAVHVEALAFELSSRFHASRGLSSVADALMRSARGCFQRWGAAGKVRQLDRLHAGLRNASEPSAADDPRGFGADIDVETLLRSAQAVAAEKGIEPLMRRLMTLALEHAGAESGLLVMPRGEQLRIEARAATTGQVVQVQLKSSEASATELPLSVLHFAIRTKAPVLVDDARQSGPFAQDAYIARSQARSLLCLPLLKQGELIGLLYLENRLAPGVFTPGRVALLSLLASTAATSMENASLEEKEVLLQEVHHRVKNNLQLICSLLNLQASRIDDPAVAELFVDSRNRVRSMALVHENLYRAGNFARVPMAAHIRKLCEQLARAYGASGADEGRVTLNCEVEDIHLGLNRAVSCGLIVNELVSNALKHAFPGDRRGQVRVTLQTTPEGRCALGVSDDGVGLPGNIELATADSLGLQLVDDLSAQLHGEVEALRGIGTAFVITFDAETEAGAVP